MSQLNYVNFVDMIAEELSLKMVIMLLAKP